MKTLILALSLLFRTAALAGYDVYIDGSACVNPDGAGCTRTGSDHGRTVMRCAAGTVGRFDCPVFITSSAGSGLTVAPSVVEIVNVSGTGSGNLCYAVTPYVVTTGTNVTATMAGGTESAVVSASLSSMSCNSGQAACLLGGTSAVPALNLSTAASCVGTACTDRQAWVRFAWKAACSGAVATGNYDFPFFKLSIP